MYQRRVDFKRRFFGLTLIVALLACAVMSNGVVQASDHIGVYASSKLYLSGEPA